jgi:hypothetical protein
MAIDLHRFWNRSLPQTLLSALWLLYLRAVFDLLDFLQDTDRVGITKAVKGSGAGSLVWLIVIAGAVAAGYYIAQEKKIGYYIGIAVAVAPFLINFWVALDFKGVSFIERFTLGEIGQFNTLLWLMFTVALVMLLLHPMSRDYVRVWFK